MSNSVLHHWLPRLEDDYVLLTPMDIQVPNLWES